MGTTTTTYVIDIATPLTMVLAETTGTDTIHYLHGLDLIAQSNGASTEYFAYDGLGSVRQVLDAAGLPLMTQTFDPYGNPYSYAGPTESVTSFGYTGEQTDSNGLVFLRARYYAPSMGRFMNMDPSRQERNPYQYSYNNPLNYTDPSGLTPNRNLAVANARYYARMRWEDWRNTAYPTIGLDDDPNDPRPTRSEIEAEKCQDCTIFVSFVLHQAGFPMSGTQDANGFYLQPYDKNSWWDNSSRGGGQSKSWYDVDSFLAFWLSHGARETWDLDELGLGDVIVYDYHGDGIPYGGGWDHVAILTSWDQSGVPRVTGRGYIDNDYLRQQNALAAGSITQQQFDEWLDANYRDVCDPNWNDVDTAITYHWYQKIIGLRLPYAPFPRQPVPAPF